MDHSIETVDLKKRRYNYIQYGYVTQKPSLRDVVDIDKVWTIEFSQPTKSPVTSENLFGTLSLPNVEGLNIGGTLPSFWS